MEKCVKDRCQGESRGSAGFVRADRCRVEIGTRIIIGWNSLPNHRNGMTAFSKSTLRAMLLCRQNRGQAPYTARFLLFN